LFLDDKVRAVSRLSAKMTRIPLSSPLVEGRRVFRPTKTLRVELMASNPPRSLFVMPPMFIVADLSLFHVADDGFDVPRARRFVLSQ
jgi:hypothetical protein